MRDSKVQENIDDRPAAGPPASSGNAGPGFLRLFEKIQQVFQKKYFFFGAILFLTYYIAAVYNQADWDLWHRLAAGKLFLETGSVAKVDIFAYTPTKELWIDHEWLSGVIFYYLGDKFGEWGLGYLKFFLILFTFLPVFLVNKLKAGNNEKYRIVFYIVFLYAILFGFLDTIRSQAFTFAFFAIWIYLLELVKRKKNSLLIVFPLMTILWANIHGGFLAGLGILGIYGVGELLNRRESAKYFITAGICALATLVNPYGLQYWNYLVDAVMLNRTFITEWQSLDLFGPFIIAMGFKLFLIMTILALPYVLREKFTKINWSEILILTITCYLSLKHIRHNVFFVIASAAYMQEYFYSSVKYYLSFIPETLKKFSKHGIFSYMNFAKEFLIYGIIFFLGFLTVTFVPFKVKVSEKKFPVKSVEFIKKNQLSGNLLVLFNWGSYALWNLYPQCRISIDGRYEEVYKTELVNESARFHYVGKDWQDFMLNYKTDLILIDKSYPVFVELLHLDDWKIVHQDGVSAVFLPIEKHREKMIEPEESITSKKDIFDSDIAEKQE